METQTRWIGTEDDPHDVNWRYPHRGRNPDLSDSVELAGSIRSGICASTGWSRSAVKPNRDDRRFTPRLGCCLFSKRVTFVQILFREDV